ncbi:MAG: amino acid adenylation domain-containing protein [Bryobacteraceae bacterium]|jgi:amino acid adenylation domain-containing protein
MENHEPLSDAKRRLLNRFLRGEFGREQAEARVVRMQPRATAPAAPHQQQVWLSSQMTSTLPVYNEPITVHYRGRLNLETLERSFNELLRRHEIWRTSFASVEGRLVQVVHPLKLSIPLMDLTHLPENERGPAALRQAKADAQRPFDLATGPLLRPCVFKLADQDYRLHLTLHHIIFDGVSIYRVLVPELAALYEAFSKDQPSPLPEPDLQYGDYAFWHHQLLTDEFVANEVGYWREQLAGPLPNLELPTDRPRPAVRSYRGNMRTFSLSSELTASLKRVSRAEGVTVYMFLLAAFKTLLHRYSGQNDILVGGVTDGRRRAEFEQLMGYFLSIVTLRTRPAGELTFRDYLAEVKNSVLDALAHSDVPFDRLVQELQPKRDASRHPFFQVSFSIEPPAAPAAGDWDLTQMDIATGTSKTDLYLEIDERPEGYIARFVYNTDLFDDATIERMTGHWTTLLEAAVNDPGARLRDLPILTRQERNELCVSWNNSKCEVPATTIHQMVERQAELTPNAIAVEAGEQRLTYRQLNERANRLAHRLRSAGAGPEILVGLCVDRSIDVIAAPLAVMKAGAAYLPLDPAFPKERLAFLMEDAQPALLLVERRLAGSLPESNAEILFCDEPGGENTNPKVPAKPDSLAYVLYTSGSTGLPKGVEIQHSAVVNFLLSMQREPGFTAADSLLAVTTLSFDIAALELYLPLITGGRLVVANRDDVRDPGRLMTLLDESPCTVLQATPAAWRGLVDAGWTGSSRLKALCGGEALPRDLAAQLLPRCAELWNLYGPTETTIWSTIHRVTSANSAVPIGCPIANTEILILDSNLSLVPANVPGELYIGGAGVARGYLRRPELTSERFISHPDKPEARIYRTGDVARWLPDGTLEYLGRADNQVKVRGFRIEPEEIEAALLKHPDVRAAAVRSWSDASGGMSLAAYVIAGAKNLDLRAFLKQKLPDYMIPSRVVLLDALPLTPNGKIDRQALPKPATVETAAEFAAPTNPVEQRLRSIWEEVLDVRPISVRDNFFDLGGHSFLVAKLLRQIDIEFGKRVSMADVFHAPTIDQLALLLAGPSAAESLPITIRRQAAGTRSPLLWLYAGPICRALSMRISAEWPLISVALKPADEALLPDSCTLEEVAALVVQQVRAVQPQGPYHLAGWCAAGVLAYEVAAQLVRAGETVESLILVDASNPTYYFNLSKYRLAASNIHHHLKISLRLAPRDAWAYLHDRILGMVKAAPSRQDLRSFADKVSQAVVKYTPKSYSGRVTLIRSMQRPEIPAAHLGWPELVQGEFELLESPGDHISMFREPHVSELAARISQCLRTPVSARTKRTMGA